MENKIMDMNWLFENFSLEERKELAIGANCSALSAVLLTKNKDDEFFKNLSKDELDEIEDFEWNPNLEDFIKFLVHFGYVLKLEKEN